MSKYIDAEWLSELFPDTGEGDWTYNATAQGYIDSAPSIDIVRCKECNKHNTHRCHMAFDLIATEDDDFCSYGEREGE